jgi:biotin transporter BioY
MIGATLFLWMMSPTDPFNGFLASFATGALLISTVASGARVDVRVTIFGVAFISNQAVEAATGAVGLPLLRRYGDVVLPGRERPIGVHTFVDAEPRGGSHRSR